jgi:hypothetical protein
MASLKGADSASPELGLWLQERAHRHSDAKESINTEFVLLNLPVERVDVRSAGIT